MVQGENILSRRGFTLVETAVAITIIALIIGFAAGASRSMIDEARTVQTRQKMVAIETALYNFRKQFDRIPCPADLTLAASHANYGVEAANAGYCTGSVPAANNSVTQFAEGGVPVKTLGLPADYVYDGWGERFRYGMNAELAIAKSFSKHIPGLNCVGMTIKDANGNNRTTRGVYALVSHGANGHGGYTQTGAMKNYGSTNTDEQINCHCTAAAVAGTYAATYVQKEPTGDTLSSLNTFDDIVTYKTLEQMVTPETVVYDGPLLLSAHHMVASSSATGQVQAPVQIGKYDCTNSFTHAPFHSVSGTSVNWFTSVAMHQSIAWSPDNKYVAVALSDVSSYVPNAYVIYKRDGMQLKYVTDLASQASNLTSKSFYGAQWSHNGRFLAIGLNDSPTGKQYIFKHDGDTFTVVPTSAPNYAQEFWPTWTADDQYVIFGRNIFKRTGDYFSLLTDTQANAMIAGWVAYDAATAAISPDGTYLAATSATFGTTKIYKNNGSNVFTALTTVSDGQTNTGYLHAPPVWAPNGKYLIVTGRDVAPIALIRRNGDTFTYVGDITGSATKDINALSWSSDSQYFAIASYNYTASAPFNGTYIWQRNGDTFTYISPLPSTSDYFNIIKHSWSVAFPN